MPIELINTTPWDTEELTKFLVPLCKGTTIETILVGLKLAQPGTKREQQGLYELEGLNYFYHLKSGKSPTKVTVSVISPKRAAARTDLLDRMSQIDNLESHEIALPEKIAAGIAHAFERLAYACSNPARMGDQWNFRKHFTNEPWNCCDCTIEALKAYPLIRGNTKVRTAPPVDLERLKRRGRWALEAAEKYKLRMEKELDKAQKLGARIMKIEAKAWDDASKGQGH